jgi:hypothetical protein
MIVVPALSRDPYAVPSILWMVLMALLNYRVT